MSTAVRPRPRPGASTDQATDILVVFGISGDLVQAFSHLALIEAAARIIVAERMEEYGR